MKKKLVSALLITGMLSSMFAGCGKSAGGGGAVNADGIKEFTAFFAVPGNEINNDNEIQGLIAEKTGCKVKESWLTGQSAEEAVGTFIAGGEYPDFIDGGNSSVQLYEAGALIPIDEYYDDYPNIRNYFTGMGYAPSERWTYLLDSTVLQD